MILIPIVAIAFLGLVGASYITNPFSKFTIVRRPFTIRVVLGTLQAVNNNHRLRVRQQWYWKLFATLKITVHILSSRYVSSPRSNAKTVDGIIADIHAYRFNPHKLLLTSGDHFSAMFVRNLGVFYYPVLDTRIPSSAEDWHNRQVTYLQTVAYALGVFTIHPVPAPTIVTTGAWQATCVNYWAYPSDAVYGILYALAALRGKESAAPSDYGPKKLHLDTKPAALLLFNEYRDTLIKLYKHYRRTAFDEKTGLIKRDIHLSGAKDITQRHCAFYDNVIFWKTTELAMKLGIIPTDRAFLAKLKQTILGAFWLEDAGYFLEDLSDEGKEQGHYSSDWLIVLATGFLDPAKASERAYFSRSVEYIQAMGIDQPMAIKYQHETRAHRQFFWPRVAFASYGGDVVWSFWGMEYIKTLLLLHEHTGEKAYYQTAQKHLKAYERVMVRDGGFPETMDKQGNLYQTPFYRSVRQTSWVIGFEQARAMAARAKR
ncbi:MAG TPA: hypothetical protein VF466_00625 [Candidatus Saccharimonadales bacterium]